MRPTFRWIERRDATRYELEVDDSCGPDFAACVFGSPEVSESTTETSFAPTADLPISATAPVGRRYYWRVRSCTDETCADWSEVRYLDVGRSPKDFNGDGFADAVVGARSKDNGATNEGNVFVYYGGVGGVSADPDDTLDNPDNQDGAGFGYSVASADLNADGFGDLIVGAPSQDGGAANEGQAFVYYGSAAGLPSTPDVTLDNPDNEELAFFGSAVADAGDLDGDGYSELVVGAPSRQAGVGGVFVYAGAPGGIADTPTRTLDHPDDVAGGNFGSALASAGDFGGDGYADLLVGAPGNDPASPGGAVYVYCGSGVGIGPSNATLRNPTGLADLRFGAALASGDLNSDGHGDAVVGVPGANTVRVFLGASTGLPEAPSITLSGDGAFGTSLAAGDLDGDGIDDLLVGADEDSSAASEEGAVHFYPGTTTGPANMATRTLDNPAHDSYGHFGASVAVVGDADGDGDSEVIVGAPQQADTGQAFVYYWVPGGLSTVPSITLPEPDVQGGARFGFSVAWAAPFAPDAYRFRPIGFVFRGSDSSI